MSYSCVHCHLRCADNPDVNFCENRLQHNTYSYLIDSQWQPDRLQAARKRNSTPILPDVLPYQLLLVYVIALFHIEQCLIDIFSIHLTNAAEEIDQRSYYSRLAVAMNSLNDSYELSISLCRYIVVSGIGYTLNTALIFRKYR